MFRFKRKSWEERHQDKISKLEKKADKEEARGEIRQKEQDTRERIEKAKKKGKKPGSGWGARAARIGEGLNKASKASNAMTDSFMNIPTGTSMTGFDIPRGSIPGQPKPKKKKRKKQIVINF